MLPIVTLIHWKKDQCVYASARRLPDPDPCQLDPCALRSSSETMDLIWTFEIPFVYDEAFASRTREYIDPFTHKPAGRFAVRLQR